MGYQAIAIAPEVAVHRQRTVRGERAAIGGTQSGALSKAVASMDTRSDAFRLAT